jgi:hypothetical protein
MRVEAQRHERGNLQAVAGDVLGNVGEERFDRKRAGQTGRLGGGRRDGGRPRWGLASSEQGKCADQQQEQQRSEQVGG